MEKLKKPKILIFEDDRYTTDIYAISFAGSGFQVRVFSDYENIIDNVLKEAPDIISCDIVMPEIDGYQALKMLKENKRTKNIPVILLSVLGEKEDIEKGFQMGIVGYFVKINYTPNELVDEVKKYLFSSGKFTEEDFKPTYLRR